MTQSSALVLYHIFVLVSRVAHLTVWAVLSTLRSASGAYEGIRLATPNKVKQSPNFARFSIFSEVQHRTRNIGH